MEINYLSHGIIETGGYRHEVFFAGELQKKYPGSTLNILRNHSIYRGLGHINLQWWGWRNAIGDINIVVVRLALITILRNLFSKNRIFIVLHNYDEKDGKSFALKIYYSILFFVLKNYKTNRIKVVAVSPFFQNEFEKRFNKPVLLFPNFFDTQYLSPFKSNIKQNKIHLGQWSEKNSKEIFILAGLLKQNSYEYYFSTLDSNIPEQIKNYPVIYFQGYEDYLQAMAESKYTIAFPAINEGWNRVAHESILVGTNVIGFNKGGLGDLLREADMFIVDDAKEAMDIILGNELREAGDDFGGKYDRGNAGSFMSEP